MKIKYTLLGFFLDLFDWVVLGFLPVIGDAIDLLGTAFWLHILKSPVALIGAIEFIPLADVLPTNIFIGVYADHKGAKKS